MTSHWHKFGNQGRAPSAATVASRPHTENSDGTQPHEETRDLIELEIDAPAGLRPGRSADLHQSCCHRLLERTMNTPINPEELKTARSSPRTQPTPPSAFAIEAAIGP